ncbi:hypothetical protein EVAR_41380_1 [Eumeta japonica]|uniref:Uncharacterized protein n=1 Tax=Eumeta variegata TaxID=151549 RepID=A0A4C1X1F8_EUMVA|nr:hypothetical protein EVAR_41380_1 [Eumeta japonica]
MKQLRVSELYSEFFCEVKSNEDMRRRPKVKAHGTEHRENPEGSVTSSSVRPIAETKTYLYSRGGVIYGVAFEQESVQIDRRAINLSQFEPLCAAVNALAVGPQRCHHTGYNCGAIPITIPALET